jgi:N-acetylneuraminic acid mutarotase
LVYVFFVFGSEDFNKLLLSSVDMMISKTHLKLKEQPDTHVITVPVGQGDVDVETAWELLPVRLNEARMVHTAAVRGTMICIVGGGISANTAEVYDTATQQIQMLRCVTGKPTQMSRNRVDCASAVHKGALYVVGGYVASEDETLRSVEVYDFATQQWSLLPTEMGTARHLHGVVVCEDKLYVVGGMDEDNAYLDTVEVYDFVNEVWSILSVPMPQPRAYITNGVVQHKGKVYVVGGSTGVDLRSVAVYDITTAAWSMLSAEMMVDRRDCATAVHGNKIYVLGGRDAQQNSSLSSVGIYDTVGGAWNTMSVEMQVARFHLAAAVHGDNMFAVGGFGGADAIHTMEVLTLPSPLPWTPTRHTTFPHSVQRAVYTLMCSFARNNTLPDDVLFKIVWLLGRFAFQRALSAE